MIPRIAHLARRLLLASAVLLVGLWLAEISQTFESHDLARGAVVLAVMCLILAVGATLIELLTAPPGRERRRRLALAGILLATFVVRFVGLDFELMDRPIGDEGVFHEVSRQINDGKPFPKTFNYGHLLYYAGAFAIWFYELFPAATTWLLELFYTTVEGYGVQRLLLYGVNALLSTLAAGAVFGAAYRVAASMGELDESTPRAEPLTAGVLAGLLIAFSPLYNSVAHELIADVPAAAFAAFALYFVSRLLEREALRDYLLAGAAAGLAAASKYPGGVVAVGIVAVWVYWRVRLRAWSWRLLWAGLISMAAMVIVMPGLLVQSDLAFRGKGLDIFFGFRQYARGGWLGVQPESNLVWYGRELAGSFGWPALALGLAGLFLLARDQRRRWLLLAVYPAAYLGLIVSMSMVVRRNLQAVLPALAILGGAAIAAVVARLGERRVLAGALVALTLAVPVWRTSAWTISQTRPGTRQLANEWIEANVPEGASFIRERYTPEPDEDRYGVTTARFAAWIDPEDLRAGSWDFVILAHASYARFLNTERFKREHQDDLRDRYLEILAFPKVAEFAPSALTSGPILSIHALQNDPPAFRDGRTFLAKEATFISHPDLRRDGPDKPLQYTKRWQFAVFKEFLAAGEYRVELGVNPPVREGYLHVVDRFNHEVGTFELGTDFQVSLPADEKYLLRVFIAPPTRLYGLEISRSGPG